MYITIQIFDINDISRNLNKLRIIALYIQYREGVPEEDRRRLCQHARLKMAEIDAINGLTHLGVRITRGPADKDIKRKVKSKISSEEEYDLSRYKPVLQTVVDVRPYSHLPSPQACTHTFLTSHSYPNRITYPVNSIPQYSHT